MWRIPNSLSLGLAAAFVPAALAIGLSPGIVVAHLVAALLVLMMLVASGGIGGGAAKLLAAATVWLGPSEALLVFTVATFVPLAVAWWLPAVAGRSAVGRPVLPFAALGFAVALPASAVGIGLAGLF